MIHRAVISIVTTILIANQVAQAANPLTGRLETDTFSNPPASREKATSRDSGSLKLTPDGNSNSTEESIYCMAVLGVIVPNERARDYQFIAKAQQTSFQLDSAIRTACNMSENTFPLRPLGYGQAQFTIVSGQITERKVAKLQCTNPRFKQLFDRLLQALDVAGPKLPIPDQNSPQTPVTYSVWFDVYPKPANYRVDSFTDDYLNADGVHGVPGPNSILMVPSGRTYYPSMTTNGGAPLPLPSP